MRMLLARHAESVWNAERRFQGNTDIGLSARGRAQAEALGRALRGRRVSAAYVSPFRRARETAELALRESGVPLTVIEELRELSLGQWEGCTVDEVHMGMRVEAVWVPEAERKPTLESIQYFRPTGEPDAPYEDYRDYV